MFGKGDVIDEQQCLAICDLVNAKLSSVNVQVIQDKEQHDSWVCLKYTQSPKKLELFSPCSAFKVLTFAEAAKTKIDDVYKQFAVDNFKARNVLRPETCKKATNKDAEFTYALATAVCIAMGQPVEAFEIGVGDDGDTRFIRQKIAEILQKEGLPPQDPEGAVWQRPRN